MTAALSVLWRDVRELASEQYQHRELLVRVTARDLLLRYKQTAMGVAWAMFMPLVNTAVFSVIFMRVAPLDVGTPYPAFAYCGLLAWNLTASALRFAVTSLTSNGNLVTKVYFPREIFPFSAVAVAVVDTATASLVLAGLLVYYGIVPTAAVLWLPVILAVHLVFTAGVALLLAMGNLFYRDVKYLFEIALTVWMFSTSVVYPVHMVGGRLGQVLALNPMSPIIDSYRAVLLHGQAPAAAPLLLAAAVSFAILAVSWVVFHRAETAFAEHI